EEERPQQRPPLLVDDAGDLLGPEPPQPPPLLPPVPVDAVVDVPGQPVEVGRRGAAGVERPRVREVVGEADVPLGQRVGVHGLLRVEAALERLPVVGVAADEDGFAHGGWSVVGCPWSVEATVREQERGTSYALPFLTSTFTLHPSPWTPSASRRPRTSTSPSPRRGWATASSPGSSTSSSSRRTSSYSPCLTSAGGAGRRSSSSSSCPSSSTTSSSRCSSRGRPRGSGC